MEAKFQEEFQKELEKIREELEQQKKEFFENKIYEEVSKVQKQWALQKTKDVENFITEAKNQLDKKFQECLRKEKDRILNLVTEEYQTKISILKEQWEKEKVQSLEDLKEKFITQWNKEKSDLEKQHEMTVQKMVAEYNLKNANAEKLENELFEKMKRNLLETEKSLKDKLNAANETEKRLRQKLQKYRKHIDEITEQHTEEIETLKSSMLEKMTEIKMQNESQLKTVQEKYALQLLTTEKYHEEIIKQKNVEKFNSECQTDEVLIPKSQVLEMYKIVLYSLRKIQEDFMKYLSDSRKRATDRLQLALLEYHHQFIRNVFEDGSTNTSVNTTNSHCHQEAGGTGCNTTIRKSKQQMTQCSTVLPHLIPSTLPKTRTHFSSSSSEGSVHQVKPLNDRTRREKSAADANFDNTLASGDGCQATSDVLQPMDVSKELLRLPQQKSAFNLLTQTLKCPEYFSSNPIDGNFQEVINSCFPERLCPKRHNLS